MAALSTGLRGCRGTGHPHDVHPISLLLHQRNFALAWFSGLISLTGDWMLHTALPVYAYQITGSTMATGAMLAAVVTPRLLLGSVAGVFVDRWDRRRTLIIANVLLSLGLLPLLLVASVDDLWLVYVVAFVMAVLAQVVKPAEGALLPLLVEPHELVPANSLNALNSNLSRLVGPALGGLVVATTGLVGVAVIDGISFLVAAGLTALMVVDARPSTTCTLPATNPWASVWHDWLDGLRVVWKSRTLRLIFAFMALSSLGEGVFGSLFAPFVVQVLDGGEVGYGMIVSAQAVGGIIGSFAVAARPSMMAPARLVGIGAVLLALIDLLTFNYHVVIPGLWPGLVLMAIVGLPAAGMVVGITTLVQYATTDAYRGRVLGAIGATVACTTLIGALIGGATGDRFGIVTVLNIQGLGYGLAGLMVLLLLPAAVAAETAEQEAARADG
jgi:MFS family permease